MTLCPGGTQGQCGSNSNFAYYNYNNRYDVMVLHQVYNVSIVRTSIVLFLN